MNRRKALKITGVLGLTGIAVYSGYEHFFTSHAIRSQYFSDQKSLLAELVDVIIPKTDTSGAKEAMVHQFVIDIMQNCAAQRDQEAFATGLENLKSYCKSNYNKDFIALNNKERYEVADHFERKGRLYPGVFGKVQKKVFGEPFFTLLKHYTVNGYCVSFLGATKNFRYDFIPATFEPCIPYIPGQASWATK